MNNVNQEILNNIEQKLGKFAKDLLRVWNQRQKKTALQGIMLKVFGKIHDDTDLFEYFQTTLDLLKELIGALPPRQTETLDAKTCHEGFMKFNEYQKKYASQDDLKSPIQNVHLAYPAWVKETSGEFAQFQTLFENCMIRGTSEAACETVGSIMNIHSGRNRHLKPENFSKEIVLRYNLGPMHVLDDHDFIEDIYNREKKEYMFRTSRPDLLKTKSLTKGTAISSFHKREEEKSHFPLSFWEKK